MFIVIEMQTTGEQVATLVNSYSSQNEAEAKYHQILTAAALSTVPIHSATILSSEGFVVKSEYYEHKTDTAQN